MKLFGTICLLLTFCAILNVESASLANENEIVQTKLANVDLFDQLMKSLQDYLDKFNAERGLKAEPKEEPEIKDEQDKLPLNSQETEDGQKNEKLPDDDKPAQPEKEETKVVKPQPITTNNCSGYACPGRPMAVGK